MRPNIAGQVKTRVGRSSSPSVLKDTKLIRNALCTDWPGYFLGNKNTIVINPCGQLARVSDTKNDSSFRSSNCNISSSKPMQPVRTYGMSKDSPFHTAYTRDHPSTKQLLDYGDRRKSSNLDHVKHPKLFMTIMN